MKKENKRIKKVSKMRGQIGIRSDKDLEEMIKDIKEKLMFESDSQVCRYAIKKLHRIEILDAKAKKLQHNN
jgi:hypothetical protein